MSWRDLPPESTFSAIREAAIPSDLTGKTVLDLGGYEGAFADMCLKRGAARATVVDNRQWEAYDWQAPPRAAGIDYRDGDLMNWTEPADLVICYNVIYHCKSPWDVSEHLRSLTRETLALCTSFVPGDEPMWRVWGPGDPNWKDIVFWKPTLAGLWKLLESTGWTVEGVGRSGDHVVVRCT